MLKLVMGTTLGKHLTRWMSVEVARGGTPKWRDSRIVLLPKPGRDLAKPNSWCPISLINTISKWVDKLAAEDIQRVGEDLLHERQMGSRKGRSAQDALGHLLAWIDLTCREKARLTVGFFDVKGGFQNVTWQGVRHVIRKKGLEKWAPWLGEFCKARDIIMSWDGMDRG